MMGWLRADLYRFNDLLDFLLDLWFRVLAALFALAFTFAFGLELITVPAERFTFVNLAAGLINWGGLL